MGFIYKISTIVNNKPIVYIGFTNQKYLCSRYAIHRYHAKNNYKFCKSWMVFDEAELHGTEISYETLVHIEGNKEELRNIEKVVIECYKNNNSVICVNKNI